MPGDFVPYSTNKALEDKISGVALRHLLYILIILCLCILTRVLFMGVQFHPSRDVGDKITMGHGEEQIVYNFLYFCISDTVAQCGWGAGDKITGAIEEQSAGKRGE